MEFDIALASASPRRRELLEEAGVDFRPFPVSVDETLEPDLAADPLEAAKQVAQRKARQAVEQILCEGYEGDLAVLGADTMVVLDGRIFGKPRDAAEATAMLTELSGQRHEVITGVSLWLVHAPSMEDLDLAYRTFADVTAVTFRELSSQEISQYVATGDPMDKAGAYGIQSGAGAFVEKLEGSLDTVIGLPVSRLLREYPEVFGAEAM